MFGDCQFTCVPDCQSSLSRDNAKNLKNADYWGGHRSEDNLQAELAEQGNAALDAKP